MPQEQDQRKLKSGSFEAVEASLPKSLLPKYRATRIDSHFTDFQMEHTVQLDGIAVTRVAARLSMLTVFYDRQAIESLIHFFTSPEESAQVLIQSGATTSIRCCAGSRASKWGAR